MGLGWGVRWGDKDIYQSALLWFYCVPSLSVGLLCGPERRPTLTDYSEWCPAGYLHMLFADDHTASNTPDLF